MDPDDFCRSERFCPAPDPDPILFKFRTKFSKQEICKTKRPFHSFRELKVNVQCTVVPSIHNFRFGFETDPNPVRNGRIRPKKSPDPTGSWSATLYRYVIYSPQNIRDCVFTVQRRHLKSTPVLVFGKTYRYSSATTCQWETETGDDCIRNLAKISVVPT
jgi:hypothetical protein